MTASIQLSRRSWLMTLIHIRELLLVDGISQNGIGNWEAIAEHIGTRTKEEVEDHYKSVYLDSPHWPLPVRPSSATSFAPS